MSQSDLTALVQRQILVTWTKKPQKVPEEILSMQRENQYLGSWATKFTVNAL
jgi:hypothetical protein